jgi:hypothetical protein
MSKNIKLAKKYEWLISPQVYFLSAKILCDNLIKEIKREEFGSGDFYEQYLYRNPVEYLIYPIIYNFKHGIELYLKAIGNICDGAYDINHDLIDLLNTLISKIAKRKQTTKRDKTLQNLNNKVRTIIEKYYFGLYVPAIKHKTCPDKSNMAERYPENKNNIYKIPDLFKFTNNKKEVECWVTEKLLNEIKEDIEEIYSIFEKIAPDITFKRV